MLTLDKIYHAAFVLKDVARKTDLIEAPRLSKDCRLYLKTENLQVTGSFKVRGAYYKISQLSKEESDKGVIACSAGNHAQGVALAANLDLFKFFVQLFFQCQKLFMIHFGIFFHKFLLRQLPVWCILLVYLFHFSMLNCRLSSVWLYFI